MDIESETISIPMLQYDDACLTFSNIDEIKIKQAEQKTAKIADDNITQKIKSKILLQLSVIILNNR